MKKTEDTLKKTREVEEKLGLRYTPHRTLLSPVDTAHGFAFPAEGSSAMSVHSDHDDRFPNVRSRCQAIIIITTAVT